MLKIGNENESEINECQEVNSNYSNSVVNEKLINSNKIIDVDKLVRNIQIQKETALIKRKIIRTDVSRLEKRAKVLLVQQKLDQFVEVKSSPFQRLHDGMPKDFKNPRKKDNTFGMNQRKSAEFLINRLAPSRMILERIKFSRSGRELFPRSGVSCIRFNSMGTHLAVAGSNGVIRIFNFENCMKLMDKLQTDSIPSAEVEKMSPIAWIDTQKDISSIEWRTDKESSSMSTSLSSCCLAVSFSHYPIIRIYDFNQQDQGQKCRELTMKSQLGSSGGNMSITYFNATSTAILAGSVSGTIRYWDLRNPSSNLMKWEVIGDPQMKQMSSLSSVCGICTGDLNFRTFLAVNRTGILTCWDMTKLVVHSFTSTSKPTCILRINIWETKCLRSIPTSQRVAVIAMGRLPDSMDLLSLTLQSCDVVVVNISGKNKMIVTAPGCNSHPHGAITLRAKPVLVNTAAAAASGGMGMGLSDGSGEGNKFADSPFCPAVFPAWARNVCITAIQGSNVIRFQEFFPQTPSLSRDINNRNNGSRGAIQSQLDALVRTRKSSDFTLTLPCNIVCAEKGCTEVIVDSDLRTFLCSQLLSDVSVDRASTVKFVVDMTSRCVWPSSSSGSSQGIKKSQSSSASSSHRNNDYSNMVYTIEAVYADSIRLTDPYLGPDVVRGSPVVRILAPLEIYSVAREDTPSKLQEHTVSLHSEGVYSKSDMLSGGFGNRIAPDLVLTSAVTGAASHPTLPYVALGYFDDELQILSPTFDLSL